MRLSALWLMMCLSGREKIAEHSRYEKEEKFWNNCKMN